MVTDVWLMTAYLLAGRGRSGGSVIFVQTIAEQLEYKNILHSRREGLKLGLR